MAVAFYLGLFEMKKIIIIDGLWGDPGSYAARINYPTYKYEVVFIFQCLGMPPFPKAVIAWLCE